MTTTSSAERLPRRRAVDLAICPHCGRIFVPARGGACPHCGYPLGATLDRRVGTTVPAGVIAPPVSGRRHIPTG